MKVPLRTWRDGIDQMEVPPPSTMWRDLEVRLDRDHDRRKQRFIRSLLAVAASIMVLTGVGLWALRAPLYNGSPVTIIDTWQIPDSIGGIYRYTDQLYAAYARAGISTAELHRGRHLRANRLPTTRFEASNHVDPVL